MCGMCFVLHAVLPLPQCWHIPLNGKTRWPYTIPTNTVYDYLNPSCGEHIKTIHVHVARLENFLHCWQLPFVHYFLIHLYTIHMYTYVHCRCRYKMISCIAWRAIVKWQFTSKESKSFVRTPLYICTVAISVVTFHAYNRWRSICMTQNEIKMEMICCFSVHCENFRF